MNAEVERVKVTVCGPKGDGGGWIRNWYVSDWGEGGTEGLDLGGRARYGRLERDEIKRWMMAALTWWREEAWFPPPFGSLDRVCPVLSPLDICLFYFIYFSFFISHRFHLFVSPSALRFTTWQYGTLVVVVGQGGGLETKAPSSHHPSRLFIVERG